MPAGRLPARITGFVHTPGLGFPSSRQVSDIRRKEVVIENDIAWRVNAAVDFLFGKPLSFVSKSPESQKRAEIDMLLKALFEANGGIGFFQAAKIPVWFLRQQGKEKQIFC